MSELVLTIKQAAELLECSDDLVEDMVKARTIPFVKLQSKTVIPRRALEEWLDARARESLAFGAFDIRALEAQA